MALRKPQLTRPALLIIAALAMLPARPAPAQPPSPSPDPSPPATPQAAPPEPASPAEDEPGCEKPAKPRRGGGGNDDKPREGPRWRGERSGGPMPEHVRKRLESLPADQREAFRRNWQKWSQLPPEERERLRKKHRERMEAMRREVSGLIKESGVTLDGAQREKFERYYLSERRALEIELMRELEQRRKERLPALRQKLLDTLRSGSIPDAGPPPPGPPLPPGPPPPPSPPAPSPGAPL